MHITLDFCPDQSSQQEIKFTKAKELLKSYAQNFYLLKIHLNLFEISNWVLKFENMIQIWKSFILSENLFQIWTLQICAICVFSSLISDKVEYMHFAPLRKAHVCIKFSGGVKLFQIWNKFSNFKTWFEISTKLKRIFKS